MKRGRAAGFVFLGLIATPFFLLYGPRIPRPTVPIKGAERARITIWEGRR